MVIHRVMHRQNGVMHSVLYLQDVGRKYPVACKNESGGLGTVGWWVSYGELLGDLL
jgi:hypothetical protein